MSSLAAWSVYNILLSPFFRPKEVILLELSEVYLQPLWRLDPPSGYRLVVLGVSLRVGALALQRTEFGGEPFAVEACAWTWEKMRG